MTKTEECGNMVTRYVLLIRICFIDKDVERGDAYVID